MSIEPTSPGPHLTFMLTSLGLHVILVRQGADSGCNESNIMIYLGIVEQRANELLALYLSLQQHGTTGQPWESGGHQQGGSASSALLVGPNTPAGMSTVSITVPTTAEDLESDDSEEVDTHPLTHSPTHPLIHSLTHSLTHRLQEADARRPPSQQHYRLGRLQVCGVGPR